MLGMEVSVVQFSIRDGLIVMVDQNDIELVSGFSWVGFRRPHHSTTYAVCEGSRRVYMHRLICRAPIGCDVDHRDGNGLNNTRENLRVCTHQENLFNQRKTRGRSKYKGVCFHKAFGKWQAGIAKDGRNVHLGLHWTEESAALAYNEAAARLFGEFARLNVIEDPAEKSA